MSRPPAEPRLSHSPFVLDATVLAHGQLTWEHEFSGVPFTRLRELALSDQPTVQVQLRFAMREQRPAVSGTIAAELLLTCQRCLQPMRYPVHEQFELLLVGGEAELATVPEPFEAWQVNATHADVRELVEEQLLLALPLIAKHADMAECQSHLPGVELADTETDALPTPAQAMPEPVQTPFGQLRELMRKS